ncbi:glycerol-3-phosphate acyltransferase [Curtanaerobium respiraculi]|uniref:glycerol-3-phosphate acyltransferase n=1 Tax=Curtanaerobium respiraculi TaxID=2949669 RepID=UPI0024B346DD|nr:glycerol-3-phosphate acyltransferase [Curtanaerobium respiraculi]
MVERLACLLVGYACGCFLTAEAVVRSRLGKSAFDVGSRNPGMSNVGALLGAKWAAATLAGDILKTVAGCVLARYAIAPALGLVAVAWGGLGVALGHDFPLWHRFRGGKSVAVTCSVVVLLDPLRGFASLAVGLAVVLATRQLCFGALAIVAVWCVAAFLLFGLGEVFAISAVLAGIMLAKHGGAAWRALHGEEAETNLFTKSRK